MAQYTECSLTFHSFPHRREGMRQQLPEFTGVPAGRKMQRARTRDGRLLGNGERPEDHMDRKVNESLSTVNPGQRCEVQRNGQFAHGRESTNRWFAKISKRTLKVVVLSCTYMCNRVQAIFEPNEYRVDYCFPRWKGTSLKLSARSDGTCATVG